MDYGEYPILYVDDERENLRVFELAFGSTFEIVTASCGGEGLQIVQNEPVALVLSDQKMPGMNGTEFLKKVSEIDPKTIRILVTAYGDADTLGKAINLGEIYRYIPKPWVPEDVEATLRRGIEVYALDRERDHLVRELSQLNQTSRLISQELDFERLADLLLKTITDDFGYDGASLFLADSERNWISLHAVRPENSELADRLRSTNVSEDQCPSFLQSLGAGEVRILRFEESRSYEPIVRDLVNEIAAEELLVVPLAGVRGLIGVFVVDNRRGGLGFSWDDRTLMEGLASQAVTAFENARLFSDLNSSREQVRRADRLGMLGTLAAGLAHEINNPLVTIRTFLEMAPRKRADDDDEFWGSFHSLAASEVERIRGLVDTMRKLGTGQPLDEKKSQIDLVEIAREAADLTKRRADSGNLIVECDFEEPAILIDAVRDQIHQLIMNLLLNAIDATEPGGSVALRLAFEGDQEIAVIQVEDTGCGISADDIERVFDPFFTTKSPDRGTGLGLMICHRVVQDNGGTIDVESRLGKGTIFSVRFPAVREGELGR